MAEQTRKVTGKSAAYNIAITAMFVAIITVCAWISIPASSGISFTLQLFGVCLAGALLGLKRGVAAVAAYILLGLIGVPVFSNFTASSAIVGATGGYIVGFLFTALIVGAASDLFREKKKWAFLTALICSMILGIAVCYAFGTGWFVLMMGQKGQNYTFFAAVSVCVLPYIPFDLMKIALSAALSLPLKRYVR